MDVVRGLLFAVENLSADEELTEFDGLSSDVFALYAQWLIEAELVKGGVRESTAGSRGRIERLTWQGCEFLDVARSDKLWNKAKQAIKSNTLNLSMLILKDWLQTEIKRHLPGIDV